MEEDKNLFDLASSSKKIVLFQINEPILWVFFDKNSIYVCYLLKHRSNKYILLIRKISHKAILNVITNVKPIRSIFFNHDNNKTIQYTQIKNNGLLTLDNKIIEGNVLSELLPSENFFLKDCLFNEVDPTMALVQFQ